MDYKKAKELGTMSRKDLRRRRRKGESPRQQKKYRKAFNRRKQP